jgi:hypothetical protein
MNTKMFLLKIQSREPMPNAKRTRAIMAAQKVAAGLVRVKTDPQPTPEAPKLTAEQRKEMYAPKSALAIIPKRPPMPIRAAKTTAKTGGVLLGMLTAITAGILIGETKKGIRS